MPVGRILRLIQQPELQWYHMFLYFTFPRPLATILQQSPCINP